MSEHIEAALTKAGVIQERLRARIAELERTLTAERDALREQVERYKAALTELVVLRDKVKQEDPADYERRKPGAWAEARRALHPALPLSATPTPPTDAAACPMCKNLHLVWIGRADETVLYEIPCPTCQPQRKEGK